LRKLDALCQRYNPSRYDRKYSFIFFINNKEVDKGRQLFIKYDAQRKLVRMQLKSTYKHSGHS
jgi:hypothetical protein